MVEFSGVNQIGQNWALVTQRMREAMAAVNASRWNAIRNRDPWNPRLPEVKDWRSRIKGR